jgi:hypothetical protein
MAKIRLNGKEVEVVPDNDWTTTETTNAEKALGIDYFDGSGMEQMKVAIFVSAMREDPSMMPVSLADAIGQMKLGAFVDLAKGVEEEAPLETPFGPERQPGSGHLNSDNSESLSPSVT